MRTSSKILLGAGAALALCATAGFAEAKDAREHVMTVQAPSGESVEVHYYGDVAPRVVFEPAAPASFFSMAPFADFDHIEAAMNRRFEAAMSQAQAMANASPQHLQSIGGAAPGGFCMQSVQVTQAAGQAPRVERHTYGNCGSGDASGAPKPEASSGAVNTPAPRAEGTRI